MRELPTWVLKYKTKGTNIILKNGKYYLYIVAFHLSPGIAII